MPKSLNNFSLIALSFEKCRINRNLDSRHETARNEASLSANRLITNTPLPSRYRRLIYLFVYFSCRNRSGSELDEAKVEFVFHRFYQKLSEILFVNLTDSKGAVNLITKFDQQTD
jgi:hypothetical protein